MTTLYFLDAAEFADVSAVAAAQPGARVERLPGYVTVTSASTASAAVSSRSGRAISMRMLFGSRT